MSAIQKASFGKIKASGIATASPTTKVRGRVPKLEDMDVSLIEFGPPEKRTNDRCSKITYDGQRFQWSFAALPEYSRMPFEPGLPKKDGVELGHTMSTRIDLTPAQYDKWLAIEAKFVDDMVPHRVECFPHDTKKKEKPISEEVFRSKFKTQVTAPDLDHGYAASIKIRVKHEEGKQPKIELTKVLETKKCTRPKPGTLRDLKAKCAVAATAGVDGGGYFGNVGLGLPVTLHAACVIVNLQESTGPPIDYSGVEFVDDEETPDGVPEEGSAAKGEEEEMHADDVEQAYTQDQFDDDVQA
tara:strand:+ start:173 stop:1069 length:897 start_codon:yes stop_codon:yes gene_type:complete